MDPLTMFSCPFRNDTTLQQHRLPSYGKRYEVEGRTNFLELRVCELRRIPRMRTSPYRSSRKFAQPRSNTCERSRLRSAELEALRRQEESRLFADAQLGQDRELIKVTPKAYNLAIPHLGEQRARDPHSSPGRGDGLSRDGSKPFGVGTACRPVDEDVIALGEDVQHFEVDVGEGCHEALVVPYTLGLVQGDRHTGMFCDVVLC